jgi:ribonucleotide reductase alpha subunit
LTRDLKAIGLWNSQVINDIISNDGSIQNIKNIPNDIKNLYKTTWETSQKTTINLSADRAPFIDHTQSLNIFMETPSIAKLTSMHFYGWKKGLKTGSYYIRSRPISKAEQFTVQQTSSKEELTCSLDNRESCAMCEG